VGGRAKTGQTLNGLWGGGGVGCLGVGEFGWGGGVEVGVFGPFLNELLL